MACLFCSWIEGKNQVLFERKGIFVFVASLAFTKGHLLVVPKKHIESIFDDERLAGEMFSEAMKMGKLLEGKLNVGGFTLGLNEKLHLVDPDHKTHVPHIHMHVIPRRHGEKVFDKERIHLSEEEIGELIKVLRE